LFTTKEVAELVGASHLLVRQWIVRGHLPHVAIGRYNYVRLKDLETLLRTGRPPGIVSRSRSTFSHSDAKSPAELRNMLWNRYQYTKRKTEEQLEQEGKQLEDFPTFAEWLKQGGAATKQTLRKIKNMLDGVDLETYLTSLPELKD